jgi:hypothetical protein
VKIVCGNVSSQALSACLVESQLKRCAAQQKLRFWATVLLGGHLFKVHWVCCRSGGDWSSGCLVWAGQKIGNDIFQTRQIQYLYIKFLNECQMVLLSGWNGGW